MTAQHFCLRSCLEIDFRQCSVCGERLKVFSYTDGTVKVFTLEGRTPDRSCCRKLQAGVVKTLMNDGVKNRPAATIFKRIRTKAFHTRTRGETWELVPGTEENGFVVVHSFRRHYCYYARLDDLDRNTGYIRLYRKVV